MTKGFRIGIRVMIFLFVAGVTFYLLKERDSRINTPEVKMQSKVNRAIQRDLCDRIEADLSKFKQQPTTFTRTSISIIDSETTAALRVTLRSQGVPDYFPIEYRGNTDKFSFCKDDLTNWLGIPSVGKMTREEELAYISNRLPTSKSTVITDKIAPPASVQRRIALVIGNSNYKSNPLQNPINDANSMSSTLKKLGFDVHDVRDGTAQTLEVELNQFLNRLGKYDIGLFYFSGHGVEYSGRNYLLPVNAKFNDPDEIPRVGLDVTGLIERLGRIEDKLSIIIVDACRNNPVRSRTKQLNTGLKEMVPSRGSLVGFATGPGMLAEDGNENLSPYTKHLINNINQKGLGIESVFKKTARDVEIQTGGRQIPWYMSNLTFEFSLH